MHADEEQAIARVVESLTASFPSVPASRVAECVQRVLATYDDAKIRGYVPILVAREARAAMLATASDDNAPNRTNG